MGREELKWCQLAHHQRISQPRNHFSPHSTAITKDISTFSGRMVSRDISDVAIASVHPEKTQKKLMKMMMMIIY